MVLSDKLVHDLRDLFAEVGVDGSLEDCLAELAATAGRILHVAECTIVLLTDVDGTLDAASPRAGFGPSFCVAQSQKKTVAHGAQPVRRAAPQDAGPDCGCMFSKIVLNGKVIGVVQAELPLQQKQFDKHDLDLFSILMPIITKSIQVIRLQQLLRSRFSQLALIKSGDVHVSDILTMVMHHPNQTARILARSFYREMLSAGFSFNQIIFAATEVISELSSSVRKHGQRQKKARARGADYISENWSSTDSAMQPAGRDAGTVLATSLST